MLTSKIFCGILFPMSTLNDHQENKILTQVKKVDAQHPDMTIIREAAEIIRTGGLVGFPTETVYGLGADALLPEGAKRIYAAKGRPSDNPLIVHIAEFEALDKITADMRALVKEQIVADFVSSETGKRMALAQRMGALYREKPFVMGFTEEELENYGFGAGAQMIENEVQTENAQQEIVLENVSRENHMHEEDLTLIQGIIDVFWIEDDGITVLDYKTDRVDTAQELIDRYATQLKLYADALERVFAARKLKVKEILIYSFSLEQLITL